ncbi:MAG: Signal peptidase peptidase [Actinomycetota bacterium]|jgi:signal peptidase I
MNAFRISAIPSLLMAIFLGQRLGVVKITGNSMAPTFKDGALMIYASIAKEGRRRQKQLDRLMIGDVVIFDREGQTMIKRIKRMNMSANTNQLMIWVEGDNQLESVDSRQWGPIPMNLVDAKVIS